MEPDEPVTDAAHAAQGAEQLADVLRKADDLGFDAQVVIEEGAETPGILRCGRCDRTAPVEEFERAWSRRLEGASDPDDMLHVSALRCPRCGAGGVLVCHFGPEASASEAEVLRRLRPD